MITDLQGKPEKNSINGFPENPERVKGAYKDYTYLSEKNSRKM